MMSRSTLFSSSTIDWYSALSASSSTWLSHACTIPREICTAGTSTRRSNSVTWTRLSPQTGRRPASTSAIALRERLT